MDYAVDEGTTIQELPKTLYFILKSMHTDLFLEHSSEDLFKMDWGTHKRHTQHTMLMFILLDIITNYLPNEIITDPRWKSPSNEFVL